MKYCTYCGNEMHDDAVICVKCGREVRKLTQPVNTDYVRSKDDTMATVIKVFMIIGCVSMGGFLLPLAWCIPMTISVWKKLDNHEPIGMGLKICSLLFVNLIAGICMLCMSDDL